MVLSLCLRTTAETRLSPLESFESRSSVSMLVAYLVKVLRVRLRLRLRLRDGVRGRVRLR